MKGEKATDLKSEDSPSIQLVAWEMKRPSKSASLADATDEERVEILERLEQSVMRMTVTDTEGSDFSSTVQFAYEGNDGHVSGLDQEAKSLQENTISEYAKRLEAVGVDPGSAGLESSLDRSERPQNSVQSWGLPALQINLETKITN